MQELLTALVLHFLTFYVIIYVYQFVGGNIMAISNAQKRQLTCQFCDKKKDNCQCKKYWKQVYQENRDKILKIYQNSR